MQVIVYERAGSYVKARWEGSANFCFGKDTEEAKDKLLSGPKIYGQMPTKNSVNYHFIREKEATERQTARYFRKNKKAKTRRQHAETPDSTV
jgi:hypothetical protein